MIKVENQFTVDEGHRSLLDQKTVYSIFGIKLLVKTNKNVKEIS